MDVVMMRHVGAVIIGMSMLAQGTTPRDRRRSRHVAMRPDQVWEAQKTRGIFTRAVETPPLFAIGQRVRARDINPTGHTRLPRYVRGRVGIVRLHHGGHVLPDTNAHGEGEAAQHLYTVAFSMRELWGPDASPHDEICADLWESYLEPA
jgi:nitrile hydratase